MGELKRVTVVGAGTMGSQIALQTALSGRYDVTLVDTVKGQLARARQKLVDRSVEKQRLSREKADRAMGLIDDEDNLAVAVAGADLVIEAVIESFDAKKAVFEDLGKPAKKDAILASNSSTIVISRLADFTGRPERCCNMHFFHPVTVMQLCEVVRGPKTSAVQKGLNWPMGPFHLLDFSGLDIFYGAMQDRHRLGEGPEPPELLAKLVREGRLGRKTGRGFFAYD